MRRTTWIVIGVVAAAILVVVAAMAMSGSAPTKVEVVKAKRGPISEVVTASGSVQADRVLPVVSEYSGEVKRILTKEGAQVKKDQDVIDFKWGSNAESPVKGRVVKVNAVVGASYPPGQVLMLVADMRPTYVVAKVDETDISKVKRGQLVRVFLDAYPKKKVRGRVTSIGSQSVMTEGGGTAFPVKIKLVKKARGVRLRLGMNADVDIVVKIHRNATLLPVEAVTTQNDKDTVFVVEDDKVTAEEVDLGISSDTYYEIRGGISAGDKVATSNLDKLSDGATVEVED